MKENFTERTAKAAALFRSADKVIIGAGSGLSSAAGLEYNGSRFSDKFADFIARYGMRDMYTAGFYPFETSEEKWAYWSRHIIENRYAHGALPLYARLLSLLKNKDYFVITTNVDAQFFKAGFDPSRIFAVQGDYGKFQCSRACHNALYDNEAAVTRMAAVQRNCRIESALIPKCPVCGAEMEVNIRKDGNFVEDEAWSDACSAYKRFVENCANENTVLTEIGVGYNTPGIIRFPFEKLTFARQSTHLIRINKDHPESISENDKKTISFSEDVSDVIEGISKALK